MRRVLAVLAIGFGAGLALVGPGAGPATASCEGPSLVVEPAEAARGATVSVTGRSFGDNCYDTGPPPPGEGVLGRPRQDLDLVIIQGDLEIEVAEGGAREDYAFEVDIVVPPELAPGPAWLMARVTGLPDPDPEGFAPNLTITDVPPTGAPAAVADFTPSEVAGDDATERPGAVEAAAADDDGATWLVVIGVLVLVTAGVVVVAARTR